MNKKINPDDFRAYSILEISQMLGVGKTKTREMPDSGILPVTKIGRQYFTSPTHKNIFVGQKNCHLIFLQASKIKKNPKNIGLTVIRN